MSKNQKLSKKQKSDARLALEELSGVRLALDEAYSRFDCVTDPYAMDVCIYEINALKSKYDCAVRNIKTLYS